MHPKTLFSLQLVILIALSPGIESSFGQGPYLGNGIKIGEVNQSSAIVWTRLTTNKSPDFKRLPIFTKGLPTRARSNIEMPSDIHPAAAGKVRWTWWIEGNESSRKSSEWETVGPDRDGTQQFTIQKLLPNSSYRVLVESRAEKSSEITDSLRGEFSTAPDAETPKPIRFIVVTGQAIRSIDSGADGHLAYLQMLDFQPSFFVHTGDILYYDKVPFAGNIAAARAKWNLMFSYGHNKRFHQKVASYFIKDDHDTLKNDCWPGQRYGDLTFDQGLDLFREQVSMGPKTYRTIRWGRDVQIWLTEHRDFRSPNRMPDGPEKTILGDEQKAWLKKTIAESNATFKFLITPGPIVGPDKKGKADNHSNPNFSHEGQELRDFLSKQKNLFVVCGDRHWQYYSRDPKTGLLELGCGPINDEHSFGGNPGRNAEFHKYFDAGGGFLGITVDGKEAKAEWFATNKKTANKRKATVRHSENLPFE